jgi:Carboxypeptidase regulatory-like domain/TonB dependent receptor
MSSNPRPRSDFIHAKWPGTLSIVGVTFLLLLTAAGTYGQSAAFAIFTGRATDPQGASVAGAKVTATNAETDIVRTTQTTSDGLYRFDNLPPGIYDVAIEARSFANAEAKNVKLQVGEQRDVNFSLKLAGEKQAVVVSGELPLIESTKTDVSTTIDDKDVADLPTTTSFDSVGGVSNDFEGLAASAPGVKYDNTNDSADLVGPGNVNDRGIVVNVDGGNTWDQAQILVARDSLGASVEEVKEFQVLTNNYNAEFGQAGSIILNVVTKSGTNDFHGDFHAYFRGRNLESSSYFYNLSDPASRAPFFKHEYGFTAGGPLVKDRLFWFTSLEDTAQGAPVTLLPFGDTVTVNQPTNELLWSAKIDAKLTVKHTLTVRYNVQRDTSSNVLLQTPPGSTDPSGLVNSVIHNGSLNIGVISTLTLQTVNEARFFWHRFLLSTLSASSLPGEFLPNAYIGADFCCPQGDDQNRFQYIDNLSWTRGRHAFKFGANISHFPIHALYQQFHNGEYSNFASGACTNSLFPQTDGECPSQFTIGLGPGVANTSDNIYGFYAQDSWQLRRNITVNYGLRYDRESGAFKGGTISDPQVPGGCLQSNGLIPACGSDNENWQPRLGVAWSPNYEHGIGHWLFGDPDKSVIRAAAARITEMVDLNVVVNSLIFDGNTLFTQSITTGSLGNDGSTTGQQVLNAYPNQPSIALLDLFKPVGYYGRLRPISPTLKNPQVTMASLVYQRQIGPSFTYSVGYQGVFAHGLFGEKDTNFPTPIADPAHPGYFYMPGVPDPAFGPIRTVFSDRESGYNALVITAVKRMSYHVQFQASYTWSHTLSDGEDFFGLSEPGNPLAPLSLDNASAQNDIRHLVNFSFVADTNHLLHSPVAGAILNSWIFGMMSTLQSGRPFPVSTGDASFAGLNFSALGSETMQRPNVCTPGSSAPGCAAAPVGALVATNIGSVSGTNLEVGPTGVAACIAAGQTNCAALQTTFAAPAAASTSGPVDSLTGTPVDFQYINGNLVRNAGQSLAIYRFDISLTRAIKIPKWESASLELKMDVFNLFNHPGFIFNNSFDVLNLLLLPALSVNGAPNPNFNCTASCLNPFTGLYLGANGQPLTLANFQRATFNAAKRFNGLGGPAGEVTPRIIQLAIRFRW